MTQSSPVAPAQSAFQPLQQSAFSSLEHAAFLKGLLKPFKGKGELLDLAQLCQELKAGLAQLSVQQVLSQAEGYPFSLLPIRMTRQSTGAGTVFLRWSMADRTRMGTQLWAQLLEDSRTPDRLLPDLYALEVQRIALNMQISLIHTIGRQACLCAEKMARAEATYCLRMNSSNNNHTKET